jgi:hypothetical protein
MNAHLVERSMVRATSPGTPQLCDAFRRNTGRADAPYQLVCQGTNLVAFNETARTDCRLSVFSAQGLGRALRFNLAPVGAVIGRKAWAGSSLAISSGSIQLNGGARDPIGWTTVMESTVATALNPICIGTFASETLTVEACAILGAFGQFDLTLADPMPADASVDETSTLARLRKILETWRGRLFTGTLDRLDRQLSYLLEDEEDLAELSRTPDPKIFEALLSYLAARPWIKAPSLTLTRDGIFVANWRPTSNEKARLSIDFLDDNRVHWSAVDARNPKMPTMTGGLCSFSDLDEHLRPYRGWLCL